MTIGKQMTAFKLSIIIVLIQDADLEYDPSEYPTLLQPILSGKAVVLHGSRLAGHGTHRVLSFWHSVALKKT